MQCLSFVGFVYGTFELVSMLWHHRNHPRIIIIIIVHFGHRQLPLGFFNIVFYRLLKPTFAYYMAKADQYKQ